MVFWTMVFRGFQLTLNGFYRVFYVNLLDFEGFQAEENEGGGRTGLRSAFSVATSIE